MSKKEKIEDPFKKENSISMELELIKAKIEKSHKRTKCYEQQRAALAIQGAINFLEKSKKPIDDA